MKRGRPCRCDRIDPTFGASYDVTQCRPCWLFHHDSRYRDFWSGSVESSTSCIHRAGKAHRFIVCDCPSGLPVFSCAVHGECCVATATVQREKAAEDESLSVCESCRDKTPRQVVVELQSAFYPCMHRRRGVRFDETPTCDGKPIEVFPCSLTGKECTLERQVSGAAVCAACSYRAPVLAQTRADEEKVAQARQDLEGPAGDWTLEYVTRPEVEEAHRRAFSETASMEYPYPGTFAGDGIVTLGGGQRYFPSAYVLCYTLRKLGCKLPIELWVLDERECDDEMRRVAESIEGVTVVNARSVVGDAPRCFGGWQAKIWAIMRSRFERVLFLDSDQLPVSDPTYLFDSPGFVRTGALVWRDFPNNMSCRVHPQAFRTAGLAVPGSSRIPGHPFPSDFDPQETGQSLFDKRRVWRELNVAKWHSDHSDYFYKLGYGDTTQWLLSFAVCGSDYAVAPPCDWTGNSESGAFLQPDESGKVVFQHRCQPTTKIGLERENKPFPRQQHYELMLEAIDDLRSKWDGDIYKCHPVASLSGRYFRKNGAVMLRACGSVVGDSATGATTWGEWNGRLILKRADGTPCGIFDRHGQAFVDPSSKLRLWREMPGEVACFDHDGDRQLYYDVRCHNEYRLRPRLDGASILDLGANQGFFALACLDRGASSIVCIEPSNAAIEILERNVGADCRVTTRNIAVGGSQAAVAVGELRPAPGDSQSGGLSLIGRTTDVCCECLVVPFDDLLGEQTVDLLKIDVEGFEWPILMTSGKLSQVRSIVGEWHLSEADLIAGLPIKPSLESLHSLLTQQGFAVKITHTVDGILGHFWAWRGAKHPFCDV